MFIVIGWGLQVELVLFVVVMLVGPLVWCLAVLLLCVQHCSPDNTVLQ